MTSNFGAGPARRSGQPPRPNGPGGFFRFHPTTAWLIVANVAVFAVTAVQSRSLSDNWQNSPLFADTVLFAPSVGQGEVWRILGSAFEHFGPMHLFANMWMLLIIGLGIERVVGSKNLAAVYLTSAVGGAVGAIAFTPDSLVAGASGGLFGLLGAWAVLARYYRLSASGALVLIAINVGISLFVPGISLAGHLGGLVGGALGALALLLVPGLLMRGARSRARTTTGIVAWTAVTVGGFAAAYVLAL